MQEREKRRRGDRERLVRGYESDARNLSSVCARAAMGRGPVVGFVLPEEFHGWVPGRVGAIEEPAEIGDEREENPDAAGQCAGEMGDGGVDGDEQIKLVDDGGGVGEIGDVGVMSRMFMEDGAWQSDGRGCRVGG